MRKIKRLVDKQILWKIGCGKVAFWYDNWSELGPLYNFLPEGYKPKNITLSIMMLNNHINWRGLDLLLSQHVVVKVNTFEISLRSTIPDSPVWTEDNSGSFSVASACQLFRKNRHKSWINMMNWQKCVPFKMNFIVWRALRDKIPTEAKVDKMDIPTSSSCCCCRFPSLETIDHLFFSGLFAQELWRILCGPIGHCIFKHLFQATYDQLVGM
ncbi:uncharacterized protein LOC142179958 [Nicotiana tabacum]|uniref:Uncharacterized protein LOC142179958 n=1 Tax=Nicotiana tabacum TaxID=4097 RepID=A0AC58UBU4_TOBAC